METIRQRMIALLIDKEMDARELSRTMGIRLAFVLEAVKIVKIKILIRM